MSEGVWFFQRHQPPSYWPYASYRVAKALSKKTTETRGMDTVEGPEGPNGEVPRPSRPFFVFVEKKSL